MNFFNSGSLFLVSTVSAHLMVFDTLLFLVTHSLGRRLDFGTGRGLVDPSLEKATFDNILLSLYFLALSKPCTTILAFKTNFNSRCLLLPEPLTTTSTRPIFKIVPEYLLQFSDSSIEARLHKTSFGQESSGALGFLLSLLTVELSPLWCSFSPFPSPGEYLPSFGAEV